MHLALFPGDTQDTTASVDVRHLVSFELHRILGLSWSIQNLGLVTEDPSGTTFMDTGLPSSRPDGDGTALPVDVVATIFQGVSPRNPRRADR